MTSTNEVSDLRIVLLGKTGSGKSATGNTILGRKAFDVFEFMKSADKLCEKREAVVGGRTISIVDTPGLFNTAVSKQQLKAELQKCVYLCAPGPHVFLLVLKLGVRFTQEERETVKWIQESFGEQALCRMIIVFTHADQLKGKPLEDYISQSSDLQKVIDICDGRYHSFNNQEKNNQNQVTELLKKIDAMLEENEMRHYTIDMFQKAPISKTGKRVTIAFVAVLGIGVSGRANLDIINVMATVGRSAAEKALGAIGKKIVAAVEAATEKIVGMTEKSVETARKPAEEKAVAMIEKALETAGVAAVETASAAIEKAVETVGDKGVAGAQVAVKCVATGSAAIKAAAAARSAAAAGKVASLGRISAVAALATAFGGGVVELISALK